MTSQLFIKMALDMWYTKIRETNHLLEKISDDQLTHEIAPGKNTGTYILGHLVAVHDRMIPLLDLGERLFPELDEIYLDNPDKARPQLLSARELRQLWTNVNSVLAERFTILTDQEWFQKHNAVSDEAFQKEPHRNRLNVVINRTNHLAYHQGQFVLIKGQ
ncbi:MAG: DinB family protein [Saprospiraceae bacterium]|nr:DinB family protein [Saprospiraceae bacterium]